MANTRELVVNQSENIYTIIKTAMFYYNPMIPPVSVSSLCGQNYEQQTLFSVRKCKKVSACNGKVLLHKNK